MYAKIDRQFLQQDNSWFMNPEELYIFTALALCERKDGVSRINYHTIDSILPEKFDRSRPKNNSGIAKVLKTLSKRSFIKLDTIPDNKSYYDFFHVRILYDNWEKEKRIKGEWLGFEKLYWEEFNNSQKINYFYMYCIVKTNQGTGIGFKCSFDIWHERTGFSVSSVKRYLNYMVDEKIVFRRRGEFIGSSKKMQEVNIYRTYDFTEKERSSRDRNHEFEDKSAPKREYKFGDRMQNEDNPFIK